MFDNNKKQCNTKFVNHIWLVKYHIWLIQLEVTHNESDCNNV